MPPKSGARLGGGTKPSANKTPGIPKPFIAAPSSLEPLTSNLNPRHVYLIHIDPRPAAFKRKIFTVPVGMNLLITLLFLWRMYAVLPWYLQLLSSTLGYPNELTFHSEELTWGAYAFIVFRRSFTFLLDFLLGVFVWPWPYEFFLGGASTHGSPAGWRWMVGFRDREIYVRRSRPSWDTQAGEVFDDGAAGKRHDFWTKVREATNPLLLQQKTGYLLMDGSWDLDWDAMVLSTFLVDQKKIKEDEFEDPVVLVYAEKHGWVTLESDTKGTASEEERRKHVFAFRDALSALGKEDLFFRWIEIVQVETSKPGGFGVERQAEVAEQIRKLFADNGVDFDAVWEGVITKLTAKS
ncbi:hypothetical protein OQA88_8506 [Cercophora sp. LCS_1]